MIEVPEKDDDGHPCRGGGPGPGAEGLGPRRLHGGFSVDEHRPPPGRLRERKIERVEQLSKLCDQGKRSELDYA